MAEPRIRAATAADLPRLTEIYNYYVIHTPITFDVEPYTIEKRVASAALHARFGFKPVGVFRENGRKFGRDWDETWVERPLRLE